MVWFCESCEEQVPRENVSAAGLCQFCQMGVDAENRLFAEEYFAEAIAEPKGED